MAAPDEIPDGPIRVVYADDSFLMRQALEAVLERLNGVEAVAGCADCEALLAAVEEQGPDVVVTDMRMPPSGDQEGIRVAYRLRQRHPRIVLAVDDHAAFLGAMRAVVGATSGFEVVAEAQTGEDALAVAARSRPDLFLVDVHLPGIDGCELTRRLKVITPTPWCS